MTVDWLPLGASAGVAALSVAVALVPGAWLGWLLARREFRGRTFVAAASSLPLAAPPLILGTYLAFAWAQQPFGVTLISSGPPAGFTWRVAAIAGACSAFPAIVRAARGAFEMLPRDYDRAASSLGVSGWRIFRVVEIPLVYRTLAAAAALAFARLAAEYAVTLLAAASAADRRSMFRGPLLPIIAVASLAAIYFSTRLERRQAGV